MTSRLRNIADRPRTSKVLDPRTLGRPTHLLEHAAAALSARLSLFLQTRTGRRQQEPITVTDVSFKTHAPRMRGLPWRVYPVAVGDIGVHLARPLLLALVDARYGPQAARAAEASAATEAVLPDAAAPITAASGCAVPVTATERRLTRTLGLELARLVAAAMDPDAMDPIDALDATNTPTAKGVTSAAAAAEQPGASTDMFIVCRLRDAEGASMGAIGFSLDGRWQAQVFARLARELPRPPRAKRPGRPLAHQLRIRLTAELVQTEVEFGKVLQMQPGTVVPVSLHSRARVLAGDTELFTALIADHNGTLCLTSFEPVE